MINHVHAETSRAWDPKHDYAQVERSLRQQERELALIAGMLGGVTVATSDARLDAVRRSVDALDEALRRLEEADPRQGRVVECRFFGGLTIEETAAVLGVSPRTVKRDWAVAQAWLHREMSASA